MKKNLALIIALVAVSSLASFGIVQAKGITGKLHSQKVNINMPKDPVINLSLAAVRENQASLQSETSLTSVITKGGKLIDMRTKALTKLKTSINNSKLTADQKTALSSMIDDNITGLTQLKTKLSAETDLTAAKADVNSIFVDYRIYGVFLPKINALRLIDMDSNHLSTLQNTTFINYQAKIDALKTSGGNATLIANMEAGLAKAKTDASTASNLINSTQTEAQNLKPADYPTQSKTALNEIRANLNKIRADFRMIRIDLGIKGKVNVMTK
jgi:hypothetical protein